MELAEIRETPKDKLGKCEDWDYLHSARSTTESELVANNRWLVK